MIASSHLRHEESCPNGYTASVGDETPTPSIEQQATPTAMQLCSEMDWQPSSAAAASADNNTYDHFPLHRSLSATGFPRRNASVRSAMAVMHSSAGSLSPGSAFSSPQLAAALTDLTPLPSPIQLPGTPWRVGSSFSLSRTSSASSHRESSTTLSSSRTADTGITSRSSSLRVPNSGPTTTPSKHTYQNLQTQQTTSGSPAGSRPTHGRNRSISEYVPPALQTQASRNVTVPAGSTSVHYSTQPTTRGLGLHPQLHREEYLAVQRGLVWPVEHPASSQLGYDSADSQTYDVWSVRSRQRRRYRKIRQLGQGAFSEVVLGVREEYTDPHTTTIYTGPPRLVAIKVVEFGPAGGADEDRVKVSLKREVEILKSINHPSLVQLKAYGSDGKTALLALDYCPGGDLFEVASHGSSCLTPAVIRRIFAELVDAVRYLHRNLIVHRDIKLENVLLNIPVADTSLVEDWRTYPRALVTLSDLGLSRRIPEPPESPLLTTRCGSEDYAAPEILMGQPYDGRSTDGWALAVLLYALMEGRLPFDPLPGTRGDPAKLRARTPHRIARCEWSWYKYADQDGEWDPVKGCELEGARLCVEGLLRRSSRRMTLDQVAEMEWVAVAIDVPEGLKRGDKETP